MNPTSRRRFLQQTGLGLAAAATLERPSLAALKDSSASAAIPAHRPVEVPGVHAYTDAESVPAGGVITFHVSNSLPCRLEICSLGPKMDDPAVDEILHATKLLPPSPQPIHPGSYVHVARGLRGPQPSLTLECWVRPWKIKSSAGLLTQFNREGGCEFALGCDSEGRVTFQLRGGAQTSYHTTRGDVLKSARWHHVVAVWDGRTKEVWINGRSEGSWPAAFKNELPLTGGVLRLGASEQGGLTNHFLDGDLALPAIHSSALGEEAIKLRFRDKARTAPTGPAVLACWPLDEERGAVVRDLATSGRHGRIINHGTWMIGGPGFKPDVTRFGAYDPARDDTRAHALRLASDDLYDCRWQSTFRYRLPSNARSGIYVGRFHYEQNGKPHLYHATFIVRRAPRRRKAPVLVLASTNTWRAYSGTPFANGSPNLKQVWGTDGFKNGPNDPPAYNFYRRHAGGQGTYQVGLRMPWPVAGPYVLYGGPTDYSHLARADRFAHVWLEQSGYAFDVVADSDLHRDPSMLKGYDAFIVNGHSEYWSLEMYRGLESYLRSGGNLVCLSGNSLFWRVTYNDDQSIIECRKVDAPGEQVPAGQRGESWHSHDGLRGGMLRECGFPGWKLIGLETLGWNNQSVPDQFGPYTVDDPSHFLFTRPEASGLRKGDAFGQGPAGKLPRANGHEIDIRLSTLSALQEKPSPESASVPADPAGITRIANGSITWKIGGAAFDYFFRPIKPATDQGGEMIYWERPEGGKVFNAGSIGSGAALLADEKFQVLLRNTLHHFGVTRKVA